MERYPQRLDECKLGADGKNNTGLWSWWRGQYQREEAVNGQVELSTEDNNYCGAAPVLYSNVRSSCLTDTNLDIHEDSGTDNQGKTGWLSSKYAEHKVCRARSKPDPFHWHQQIEVGQTTHDAPHGSISVALMLSRELSLYNGSG